MQGHLRSSADRHRRRRTKADGRGRIRCPDYAPGYDENHFIRSLLFENGRIKQNREFINRFQQLRVGASLRHLRP